MELTVSVHQNLWKSWKKYDNPGSDETSVWGSSPLPLVCTVPSEKGSMRQYIVMMQQAVLFVAEVEVEVFVHFHAVTVNHCSSILIQLFGLPEEILYKQSP
jgi:hypothetical protein